MNNSSVNLPNLILAGVNKAGTTSMFSYLSAHPDIGASSIKETFYFMPIFWKEDLQPLHEYQKHFSHVKDCRYIMESTPRYLYGGKDVAVAIKDTLGEIKILIMLRNPVDRLYSFFRYKKSTLHIHKHCSFDQFIHQCKEITSEELELRKNGLYRAVEEGYYVKFLEEWFTVFPDTTKVVFFEDFKANIPQLLVNIANWLKIDESAFQHIDFKTENKTSSYRFQGLQNMALNLYKYGEKFWTANPSLKRQAGNLLTLLNGQKSKDVLTQDTRKSLNQLYQPYNKRLGVFLREKGLHDLPEWVR